MQYKYALQNNGKTNLEFGKCGQPLLEMTGGSTLKSE